MSSSDESGDEGGPPPRDPVARRRAVEDRLEAATRAGGGDPGYQSLLSTSEMGGVHSNAAMKALERLYRDHPGSAFRAACREEIEERDSVGDLVYGEVGMLALMHILRRALPYCRTGTGVFYDLGSGGGRPVFAAALLQPELRKVVGLEIIPGVHELAAEVLQLYEAEARPFLPERHREQVVELRCADFLAEDWSDADLVLSNSTCFSQGLVDRMEERAVEILRPGAVFVTLSKRFKHNCWELVETFERRMSWGAAVVHIHFKAS